LSDFIAIRIVVQGLETHSRTSAYKVFCYLREVGRARFSEIARITPPLIKLPLFVLTATVIITLLSAIGLLIAAFVTSSRELASTVSLVTNILVFTSSAILPPSLLSEPFNLIVKYNPLSLATDITRHVIFAEYLDIVFIFERLLCLTIITVALTIVGVKLYEKSIVSKS